MNLSRGDLTVPFSVLVLGAALCTGSDPAWSQVGATAVKKENVKLEIVSSVSQAKFDYSPLEYLVWCFDATPAFVFVKGKSIFMGTFDGTQTEILQTDVLLTPTSVRCT